MKVFLTWSGSRGKQVAKALRDWLPLVVQAAKPWMSESDIEKGAHWPKELAGQLEDAKVGIVCLTVDSLDEPWLLFEAGALSKTKDALVCTFTLDVKPSKVKPPLGFFQATKSTKGDVKKLVRSIANRLDSGDRPPTEVLEKSFEKFWGDLKAQLDEVMKQQPSTDEPAPRDSEEVLEEILATVRRLDRRSGPDLGSGILRLAAPTATAKTLLPAIGGLPTDNVFESPSPPSDEGDTE